MRTSLYDLDREARGLPPAPKSSALELFRGIQKSPTSSTWLLRAAADFAGRDADQCLADAQTLLVLAWHMVSEERGRLLNQGGK